MADQQTPEVVNEAAAPRRQELVTIIGILVIVVVVVAAVVLASKKNAQITNGAKTQATAAGAAATTSASSSAASLKDGSYTATGAYQSPGGSQTITVSVTLKNGVVTDSSATNGASDPESQEYQGDFINNYKQQVVGKPINGLSLSRVSGSSLTSQGFNDALAQIRQKASS